MPDIRFKENLKHLRKQKRETQAQTADALELGRTTYANYETGFSNPGMAELQVIAKYFDTSIDDLITKDLTKVAIPKKKEMPTERNKIDKKGNLIPFYDVEAAAGNNVSVDVLPVSNPAGTIDVGDLLRDSEAAIRIYGNSMVPNYPSGCVVGLREVRDGIVEYGNVYVLETADNRYLKRLFKDKTGKGYICYSDNNQVFSEGTRKGEPYYEPFTIPLTAIVRIYRVTGVIKRNENSPIMR